VNLWNASAVTAAVRSAHSAATAVAACQAAASCRSGLSSVVLTGPSSHPGGTVTSALPRVCAAAGACLRYAGPGDAADRTTAGRGARPSRTALPSRGAGLGPGTRGWQTVVRAAAATP
jgi:hypothetical protein